MLDRELTVAEVAARLQVHPRVIHKRIREFNIPVLRPKRREIRFDEVAYNARKEALRGAADPVVPASSFGTLRARLPLQTRSPGSALDAALKATAPNSPRRKPPKRTSRPREQ